MYLHPPILTPLYPHAPVSSPPVSSSPCILMPLYPHLPVSSPPCILIHLYPHLPPPVFSCPCIRGATLILPSACRLKKEGRYGLHDECCTGTELGMCVCVCVCVCCVEGALTETNSAGIFSFSHYAILTWNILSFYNYNLLFFNDLLKL